MDLASLATLPHETACGSPTDLASPLRNAAAAHGEHEKCTGRQDDENLPDRHAAYMVREPSGADLLS